MYVIREARDSDTNFILATWKRGYRDSAWGRRFLEDWEYYAVINRIMPEVIGQKCQVLVACLDEDEDVVLGWLASTELDGRNTLVYGFVKEMFRETGIFRALMKESGVDHFSIGITKALAHGRKPGTRQDAA